MASSISCLAHDLCAPGSVYYDACSWFNIVRDQCLENSLFVQVNVYGVCYRANCVQLESSAINHYQIYYLWSDTAEKSQVSREIIYVVVCCGWAV